MINKERLLSMRTRWLRWLGQKTRKDKPYYTTLLDSNWMGWAQNVLDKNFLDLPISIKSSREQIKDFWRCAICVADVSDLLKLDNLYDDLLL